MEFQVFCSYPSFLVPSPHQADKRLGFVSVVVALQLASLAEGARAGRSRLGWRPVGAVRVNGQLYVLLVCDGGTQVGG